MESGKLLATPISTTRLPELDAGGVFGKVEAMNLVSTSILTFDNQKVVVPNNKIWGDVINNVTARDTRRIDMVFGIGYGDDIKKAKQVLERGLDRFPDDESMIERLYQLSYDDGDSIEVTDRFRRKHEDAPLAWWYSGKARFEEAVARLGDRLEHLPTDSAEQACKLRWKWGSSARAREAITEGARRAVTRAARGVQSIYADHGLLARLVVANIVRLFAVSAQLYFSFRAVSTPLAILATIPSTTIPALIGMPL